ncbi:hypothetical protein DM860_014486 [Cuscuta australis]|uniref:Replication protein A 70 kDa DNA-binding subunit B/D first OB fold domain-containing protein n=1 Tax=Cuscuta australis TaxID=267555 RepID=A0A328DXS7_9ASTE|nr:hypothetical protein DM860_014486 [Cuscuta australis]
MSLKPIHPLSKINPTSECWRICVRVIRLYTLPSFNDNKAINSIKMVFLDEHGTTIHATVRRSLVGTFESVINEGSTYVFAYFGVGNNSGNYRTSRHEFRLNFQPMTTVTTCSMEKIPLYRIKLVAFPDILQADSNYPYLVGEIACFPVIYDVYDVTQIDWPVIIFYNFEFHCDNSDTMGMLAAVGNEKEIVKESKRIKIIVITLEAEGYYNIHLLLEKKITYTAQIMVNESSFIIWQTA